ncbi:MAG TPA: Na+:solute symporter [Leptospiraceae bacterium]|nr:Na+:solute symporter [Leptospiraceae bacterium]HMZ37701.1 Na+:solute symporter [Leptospiraceae bacterium]HNL01951.1 Na+:solute symporter [Leptospiraceae bacterium]
MEFHVSDFVVIAIYFIVSLGAGLLGSRNKSSLQEFFISGGRAPFWLVGTGMVATTFAADTPLAVAGLVGKNGIAGNWIWWCSAAGGMLTVFFFARLWRRSGITTDLELIELRYSGKAAAILRGSKAIYFGLIINCIILGWVNLAMLKIFQGMIPGIDARWLVTGSAIITALYVAVSGLWGVAITDAFQFAIAMIGCIVLALIAAFHPQIQAAGGIAHVLPPSVYNFFPTFHSDPVQSADLSPLYTIPLTSFLAFILVQWWASWYPGAEPGGGGYIAQRILSARDEKHGMLATLWFVIAHYCVRPWPWIIAGIAALALYPGLLPQEKESGYVYLMRDLLPSPYRGLLIAAFLGAYMSTLSTHLHWGSSYLIHDFYQRFVKKNASERHYLLGARLCTILLLCVSLFVTFNLLETISGAWEILLEFGAGTGFVLILRWYYWRINAISEITAMIVPAICVLLIHFLPRAFGEPESGSMLATLVKFPGNLFLIVSTTIAFTLLATFLTRPEPEHVLQNFAKIVRPAGPGFKRFGGSGVLWPKFAGWISGTALTYAVLFLSGYLLFGMWERAAYFSVLAIVSLIALIYSIQKDTA